MALKKYPRRSQLDDRLEVVCTSTLKQRAYEAAAAKGITAAQFVREAISMALGQAA